jgi:2-octaprenyl-6-methoxyphenol hydroxylase
VALWKVASIPPLAYTGGMASTRRTEVDDYGIVIAGSGFVGGTLAVALAKLAPSDFRIALVDGTEGAPARSDSRGLALSAAARNLLDSIGLWSAIEPRAQPIESIEITDSALGASLRPHFLGFDKEMKAEAPRAYVVEAGVLLETIADAIAADRAITAHEPDRITDYEPDVYAMRAHLDSGAILKAPLLVAADGKRSRLRERAGIKTIGWSYPQIGIVATVAHEYPHKGKAVQHFLPAGPFAMLPLSGHRSSIVWTEDPETTEVLMSGDDAAFAEALAQRFGHRLGRITIEGPKQSFPLSFQMARSFVGDRIALIGDAAHVVHPLAGQGLNIGLRDVAALTETLIETMRLGLDIGSATTLERYERWRRFDSAFSGTAMDALNRLFSNDNAPLRALRDLGLGLVDRAPALKRFLVREAAGGTGDVPRLLKGEAL